MGSLLARPLSAVPAVCKEAGFSSIKHFRTLFDYVELIRSCLDPFLTILNLFPLSKNRNGIRNPSNVITILAVIPKLNKRVVDAFLYDYIV